MYWRCWACKVVDLVDLQQDGFHNIVPNELEVWLAQEMRNVIFAASKETVNAYYLAKQPHHRLITLYNEGSQGIDSTPR